jgi:PEP-CTERM motif
MKTHTKHLIASAGVALLAALGGNAHAQVSTGTLTGWSVLGDAVTQGGAITVTTAFLDAAGDQAHNLSGNSAALISDVETAAGVAPFALDLPVDHYGTEGSVVSQSFTAAAGQALNFEWSFATFDDTYLDHAFVVIGGELFTLATTAQPGGGLQSFSHTFAQGGQVTLAFGVVDTDDVDGVSSLSISNLQLGTVAAPVPEPQTYALMLAGLGLLAGVARRRGR